MARFLAHCNETAWRPDWLAGDAVQIEPVSAPNSLLTGKNTGKFTKPTRSQRGIPVKRVENSRNFDKIPCVPEQGISEGEKQGKQFREQGICP
jgi:hypothetical protein